MAFILSVTTPIFNGEDFVNRCYSMLRMQTFTDWEWVVVDDGSTDKTADLIRQIDDERVRLITYTTNRGRGYARSRALEAARGEWMVVWDIDDLYFPNRLEKIDEARRDGYDFFCSYAVVVDNNLQIKGVRGFYPAVDGLPRYFVHPTLACRIDIARKIGYEELKTVGGIGEDARIVLTLAAQYRGCFFEDALAIYQEDREVFLKKSLDSNWSQLLCVQQLYQDGVLTMNWQSYLQITLKFIIKLLILNLMRFAPHLYLKTLRRRPYGEKAPNWSLSWERLAFIEQMRRGNFEGEAVHFSK
jgi:glycosyltransferase involved in cell wall biosynthesis